MRPWVIIDFLFYRNERIELANAMVGWLNTSSLKLKNWCLTCILKIDLFLFIYCNTSNHRCRTQQLLLNWNTKGDQRPCKSSSNELLWNKLGRTNERSATAEWRASFTRARFRTSRTNVIDNTTSSTSGKQKINNIYQVGDDSLASLKKKKEKKKAFLNDFSLRGNSFTFVFALIL